jgi:hypothetical protein
MTIIAVGTTMLDTRHDAPAKMRESATEVSILDMHVCCIALIVNASTVPFALELNFPVN